MTTRAKSPQQKNRSQNESVTTLDRRHSPRTDIRHPVALLGNFGTFDAFIVNLSFMGAQVEVENPALGLPLKLEREELLNQTLNDQFGKGLVIQIKGTDLALEADVMHARLREEEEGTLTVLGCRFRRSLSREECLCLQIESPPRSQPGAGGSATPARSGRTTPSLLAPVQPAAVIEALPIQGVTNIRQYMKQSVEEGATDLHIKVGCKPRIRRSGRLTDLGTEVITAELAHTMALDLMTPEQANRFDLEGDMELTCTLERVSRFRINIFRQQGYTGLALRCIPDKVPTIEELGISPVAIKLAEKPNGLVLVTGPTGSGKSTTLAAMINHINRTRSCNIITMEDPIEYVHHDILSQVNQREIGADVTNFSTALKRCLRQDPDVIMVGEMRDLETIALALTAAETGHLVFGTLHTTSASHTPSRIIDVFPPVQHGQLRVQLADSLRGIMSQILVPREEEGLVLAQEVLIANEGVRALIRDNKPSQIYNQMQTGAQDGMQTLETALNRLVETEVISYETALAKANFPKQINARPAKKYGR